MLHDPIPHRDGEWQFDGSQWRQNYTEANKPSVQRKPWLLAKAPTWFVVLALTITLLCITIPPLATALVKGYA